MIESLFQSEITWEPVLHFSLNCSGSLFGIHRPRPHRWSFGYVLQLSSPPLPDVTGSCSSQSQSQTLIHNLLPAGHQMQRNFASCRQSWTPFANVVPSLSPPKQSQNFFFVFLKYNTKAKINRLDTVDAKVFCVPNVKDLMTFFLWYVNFAGNCYKWLLFPETSSNEGGTNILLEVLSLRNTSIKFRFPLWCYKMLAPQNYSHKLMLYSFEKGPTHLAGGIVTNQRAVGH